MDLVGKTIAMIDIQESVTIRFTDGTYLEMNSDWAYEMNGDKINFIEVWYKGHKLDYGRFGE